MLGADGVVLCALDAALGCVAFFDASEPNPPNDVPAGFVSAGFPNEKPDEGVDPCEPCPNPNDGLLLDAPPNEKPLGFCSAGLAPKRFVGGCVAGVVDAAPKLGAGDEVPAAPGCGVPLDAALSAA